MAVPHTVATKNTAQRSRPASGRASKSQYDVTSSPLSLPLLLQISAAMRARLVACCSCQPPALRSSAASASACPAGGSPLRQVVTSSGGKGAKAAAPETFCTIEMSSRVHWWAMRTLPGAEAAAGVAGGMGAPACGEQQAQAARLVSDPLVWFRKAATC